jgi:hypothetical protein
VEEMPQKVSYKYPDSTVPCKAAVCNIVTKLCSTGLMLGNFERDVLTEEQLDDIDA